MEGTMENRTSLEMEFQGKTMASNIAMTVILISFSMLFGTLFLALTVYRFNAPVWPPLGMERVSLFLPLISTLIILLSSMTYFKFQKICQEKKNFQSAKKWLNGTILLGILFFVSQLKFWFFLQSEGYFLATGIYSSVMYSFTWIHSAHIIMGLGVLAYVHLKLRKNEQISDSGTLSLIKHAGLFWHFLDIVWVLIFLTIFLI